MQIRNRMGRAILAGLASLLLSIPAAADIPPGVLTGTNLDLDEIAAALALPVITGGHPSNAIKASRGEVIVPDEAAITLATVTNGRSLPTLLRVDVISGDPSTPLQGGDTWQSDSFDCLLTGDETTTFLLLPAGEGSLVYVECSTELGADGPLADNKVLGLRAANGILWVAAADPVTGRTISQDVIFGDAIVLDLDNAQAYGFNAIPFQAGTGFNNGDKVYRFDGEEYATWPGVLATNFIAPRRAGPDLPAVNAELVLFTLDGKAGNPTPPRVALAGLGYDDDEVPFDFQWEFDCFDVVALDDLSVNFRQVFLGSLSGHLQLVPQPIGTGGIDVHDAAFGDGNNSRRRPAHGWIVQNVVVGHEAVKPGHPHAAAPGATPASGNVAWGRPLAQGRGSLLPFLLDQNPVLDAGPF